MNRRTNSKISLYFVCIALLTLTSCLSRREVFYFGNYSQAEQLFNQGDYLRAIQRYQAYIDENPEGHLAIISQYYIARSHQALGHADEAKTIYERIVRDHPDVVWANFSQTQLNEASNLISG